MTRTTLLLLLALTWTSAAFAQHPDHVALVQVVKADLESRGIPISNDACGPFQIVLRVAWQLHLQGEDAGLRFKPGGSGCVYQGVLYASDIISYPDGVNVDMLGDAGGANTPAWNPYPVDPNVIQYHRAALDPGDTPVVVNPPPPPPMPVSTLTKADLDAAVVAINAHADANRDAIQTQIDQAINNLEKQFQQVQSDPGWLRRLLGF